MAIKIVNRKILTPRKILESVRELAYDLERAQNDAEISDLIRNYFISFPLPHQRDWESIDPKFKPAILVEEFLRQWSNK